MPNTTVLTNNQYYQDIATAIRAKNGSNTQYKPREMAPAIDSLVVSGQQVTLQNKTVNPSTSPVTVTKDAGYTGLGTVTVNAIQTETRTVTENGIVTPTSGKFFSQVTVSVEAGETINNQDATITPNTTTQTISAEEGYTGLGTVTVEPIPSAYVIPSGTKTITSNGSTDVTTFATVSVNVQPSLQSKSVTPIETATTISADSGYYGLQTVTVAAISPNYVGSGVPTKSSADLTASANTVTAPAGYYASAATKTITAATQATPSVSVNTSGLITATATQAAGYVAAGTKTATLQLSTQAATTITPKATSQTAVASGKYTTGAVTVAAVPTDTNNSFSANGTYTPASGKWFNSVTVTVPSDIHNQNKTVTPTESAQTISADSGYSGLGTVTVQAIDPDYVGSGVPAKSSIDLTISGDTVTAPAGYYNSPATLTMTHRELGMPTISLNSSTGVITSTAEIASGKNGYYGVQSASRTLNLTVQTGTTITPTTASQTAVASGRYTTGTITVGPIPSQYIVPSGTTTLTSNGTYNVSQFASAVVSVPSDIRNQNKTVTPTTATQTISADSGYSGLGTVTVNPIPSNYIIPTGTTTITTNGTTNVTTFSSVVVNVQPSLQAKSLTPSTATQTVSADSGYYGLSKVTVNPIPSNYIVTTDATATASQILKDKTAYVNGSKVTGTMTNNGATGTTLTTQGSTYAIPAGYTSGGTVTVSLPVSTISNANLNVSTITESTNDYGVEASITIPAGYYNNTTLTTTISDVLPVPATAAVVSQILSGYEAYDYQGKLLAGTMTNRAAWNATLNDTLTSTTIPAGYHNGSGTVSHATVNIPDPTISLNSANGTITASGSWTKGFTTDSSYTKTYTLTTQAGTTITPTESAQTAVAQYRWTTGTVTVAAISSTYVGSGITTRTSLSTSANTVTASAGYYPNAVTYTVPAMTVPTSTSASGSGTRKITVTPSTTSQYINLPTGYNSSTAYFQINAMTSGSATPQASISATGANVTVGNNTLTFTKSITLTPQVTAGYINAGTAAARTVTLTATITTKAAATYTPSTATQTIAAGTYLTGAQTILPISDDYIDTSDATATASDIVSGETAYVDGRLITGNLVINKYYTGISAPASSLGSNGDIYFQN